MFAGRRLAVVALLLFLCGLLPVRASPANKATSKMDDDRHATCRKRRIVHTIKSPHCTPRRLLSYACQGRCSSYTQISETLEFKRHCKCCQEMGEKTAVVLVRCQDQKTGLFKRYTVLIKVPKDCMCRPCSESVRVRPLELAALGT